MNDFRMKLREANSLHLVERYHEAMSLENGLLKSYIKKAQETLEIIDKIDIKKQDEDGNFVNRGPLITMMSILKELHLLIEKLSQTGAAREYALFVKKSAVKIQLEKPNGLDIPDEVSFMDDSEEANFMKLKNVTPK